MEQIDYKKIEALNNKTIQNGCTEFEEKSAKQLIRHICNTKEIINKPTAIKNHKNICFKCLKEKDHINKYSLYRDDYGSDFDNCHTYLQVCDDCKPKDIDLWFNEKPTFIDDYCANYKYEQNIEDFVRTFPLQGQELFENSCANGACAHTMDAQDWIDMELGILPDKVYKEYCMYSPLEIDAYKERFPSCEYPVNRLYDDDSCGCWCPFGANGEKGQIASPNISNECLYCHYYKVRTTPIKEIKNEDFEDYKLYMKSKLKEKELKNKFEESDN